jgi:UDP-glucose 4-epimerase
MKVLLTGAGGNLGRVLAPALEKRGHEPVLFDFRPIETSYEFIEGDVRDREALLRASQHVDAIVHAAALHGVHLPHYTEDEFWGINVTGTHNVYQAAVKNKIPKIVFSSTMAVYGQSMYSEKNSYTSVTEDSPLLPMDIYGQSKKVGEDLARYYQRKHGIRTISLRLGMFVPENFPNYGFRLLKGGVDDRDVAKAFLLSLENENIELDAFNIMSDIPFSKEDERDLASNPRNVLERYYPGAKEIFEQKDVNVEEIMNIWGNTYWPMDKAKKGLGFQPEYNFKGFLHALKEHKEDYYPYANLPWWGVK